ncbi:MAG: hypothetical protein WC455_11675 [Dehalococcoidia bacterium]|jgi:hypothetical protein
MRIVIDGTEIGFAIQTKDDLVKCIEECKDRVVNEIYSNLSNEEIRDVLVSSEYRVGERLIMEAGNRLMEGGVKK